MMPGLCAMLVKCVQAEDEKKSYNDFTEQFYSAGSKSSKGFALTAFRYEALATMSLQLVKLDRSDVFSEFSKPTG